MSLVDLLPVHGDKGWVRGWESRRMRVWQTLHLYLNLNLPFEFFQRDKALSDFWNKFRWINRKFCQLTVDLTDILSEIHFPCIRTFSQEILPCPEYFRFGYWRVQTFISETLRFINQQHWSFTNSGFVVFIIVWQNECGWQMINN